MDNELDSASLVWPSISLARRLLIMAQDSLPAEQVPEAFRIRLRVAISRMEDLVDTEQFQEQLATSGPTRLPCGGCPYHGVAIAEYGSRFICNGGPAVCAGLAKIGYRPKGASETAES